LDNLPDCPGGKADQINLKGNKQVKTTNSFNINFFLKKDKGSRGNAPMYARIRVNGKFTDISIARTVNIKAWDQKDQKLTGNDQGAKDIREKMRQINNEINNAYDFLRYGKQIVTADNIKAKVEGVEEEQISLLWLINYHNTEIKTLLEPGTMKNYYTTERYIKEFLSVKKRRKDLYLSQLDYKFLIDFEIYLRHREPEKGHRPCTNNTVMKHIERLRKIINIAVKNDWIVKDPFIRFERHMIIKDRGCLESEELETIKTLDLQESTLQIIRDIFVFCCYTGLSYADISLFSDEHLVTDIEGEKWIEMVRKKTANFSGHKFFVLLLPDALSLIKKYRGDPKAGFTNTIFPVFSNQFVNRCLKKIGKLAGISLLLTFHIARHTFATTVTLENGVPIESVSEMLGHTTIRTTQIYSKVKKRKVSADMKALKQKLMKADDCKTLAKLN
jgi:integrase/recombinase XerD